MSMVRASRQSWLGAQPVFLLDIVWSGRTYRFSTKPITISDGSKKYQYRGKLEDPVFTLRSDRLGYDVESNSIPIALVFDDTNIAERQMQGDTIEGSKAELFFIVADDATMEQRIIITTGIVSQPVYAHQNQPLGYVEFSIESDALFLSGSLMDGVNPFHTVDDDLLNGSFFGVTNVEDLHRGKIAPIVFGEMLSVLRPLGNTAKLFTIPGYFLGTDSLNYVFIFACNELVASTGTISDGEGHTVTFDITKAHASDGVAQILSLCSVQSTTSGFSDLINPLVDESQQYWMNIDSGGIPNPFGTGALSGAGDVCLWALTATNAVVDYDSWYSARSFLNRYKLAGVIQDPEINGFEWLQKNILPYLPVDVVLGAKGLKPILNILVDGVAVRVAAKVNAGSHFYAASPVTPVNEPDDICNELTVRYAFEGLRDSYRGHLKISATRPGASWTFIKDEYAFISQQRYGKKLKEIELLYVYDYKTAVQIAKDYIRFKSMPILSIEYFASSEYGYLELGDVIELTDNSVGLRNQKVQLLAKQWDGARWVLTLQIEDNSVANQRSLPS